MIQVKATHNVLHDGLHVLWNNGIVLNEEQYKAILAVAVHKKDHSLFGCFPGRF